MATFKVQVEDITGSVGDDTALSSWLQDGAKEVINFIPKIRLEEVASTSVFENTIDVEGKKVLGVLRKDANNSSLLTPCVKVAPTKKGIIQDSSNMEYATTSDPAYWVDGDTLQVFPTSASTNDMSLVHISFDFSAVTYDDSSITNFPDEAEPAVVLYATRNALQRLMTDTISNSDITTALTAVNTELDELQSIADNVHTEVALINAQADSALTEIGLANAEIDKMAAETGLDNAELDLAKVELAEAAVLVDSGIDTATAAIATAAGRVNTAVALANAEFDKAETEADSAEAEADDGAVATALGLINTQVDAAVALITADPGVTDRLAAGEAAIDLAAAEIVLAKAEAAEIATQTDNSGDFETALELDKSTALLDLGEADSEGAVNTAIALLTTAVAQAATAADKFISADSDSVFGDESTFLTNDSQLTRVKNALDKASDIINGNQPSTTTDAFGAQANEDIELVTSALNIVQSEIARAQAHLAEWTSIGDMRVKEVQVALNEADGQSKKIQILLQQAQAKREESQSRLAAGNAYLQESQAIVSQGNAYIQEAQAVISQAQGYAAEVSARASFTGAKGQAVQAHISTAQNRLSEAQAEIALANGYSGAIAAYINSAQGYAAEVQAYISTTQMFINTASNRINAGNAFLAEANASAGEAQSYIGEVNARVSQVQGQIGVAQGYIQNGAGYSRVADGYAKAAQGFLGTAGTYLSAGQGFASSAQGYTSEVQSKIGIASGYLQEVQGRLSVDTAKYGWYTQQYQMVDARYKEFIQSLRGTNA